MSTLPYKTKILEPTTPASETCVASDSELETDDLTITQTGNRLLAGEALGLVICLNWDLREARAQFNQDWFRRIMRARHRAVSRLRRRWAAISPPPSIPLGTFRRRYHANLAKYLSES